MKTNERKTNQMIGCRQLRHVLVVWPEFLIWELSNTARIQRYPSTDVTKLGQERCAPEEKL